MRSVQQGLQEYQEREELQVQLVTAVPQDRLAIPALLEGLDKQDFLVNRDRVVIEARLDSLVQLVSMESMDRQDKLEQQVCLVQLDLLVRQVSLVQPASLVPMDSLDLSETQDPLDLTVTLEMVVSQGSQDQQAEPV